MQVHIVSFEPTEDANSAIGGTQWSIHKQPIDDFYAACVADDDTHGEDDVYQYVADLPEHLTPAIPLQPTDEERDAITTWVDDEFSNPQNPDTPALPTRSRMMGGDYWIVTIDGSESYHRGRTTAEQMFAAAATTTKDVQLSIEHNPSAGDAGEGEYVTHLVRDNRDADRTLVVNQSTLRLIKAALRNLHIDLAEAPDFSPWTEQKSDPTEDRLASRSGMEAALADAVRATNAVLNTAPGSEPHIDALHVTNEQLSEFQDAVTVAENAADGDSNDQEIEALQDVRDLAVRIIGLGKRPAGGRQHVLSSIVTLDTDDARRIDSFRGQALSFLSTQLVDEFQGGGLMGYDGAEVVGTPTFHLDEEPTATVAPKQPLPALDPRAAVTLTLSNDVSDVAYEFNPTDVDDATRAVGGDLAHSGGNIWLKVDGHYLGSLFVAPDERTGEVSVALGTSIGSDVGWETRDAIPLSWVDRED